MKSTRTLTEGAILLAAFTVLMLLTIYVPVVGIIVNLILPLPFILFAAKTNWKSTLVFFIAALIISFITGTIFALPLTFAYGLTGAVMGSLIQLNKNRISVLIAGSVVFLLNLIIQYVISVVFFHLNIIDELIRTMQDSFSMSANMLKNFGQTQDSQQVLKQFESTLGLIKTLIPSLFVITSFLIVFFIQLLSLPILKRFGIKVQNWKPFREISLPKSMIWYYLVIMAAGLIFHPQTGTYWGTALTNLTYIMQLFMIFQGVAFIFYFFYQRGASKSLPIILTVMLFFIPILLYLMVILGIMDLGFDLRRRFGKNR